MKSLHSAHLALTRRLGLSTKSTTDRKPMISISHRARQRAASISDRFPRFRAFRVFISHGFLLWTVGAFVFFFVSLEPLPDPPSTTFVKCPDGYAIRTDKGLYLPCEDFDAYHESLESGAEDRTLLLIPSISNGKIF